LGEGVIKAADILFLVVKMGLICKALLYTGFFALGFGVCYTSCVNKQYRVIEENGNIYVEDKNTGKMGRVEEDFNITPKQTVRKKLSSEEIGHDLKRRIEDAYKALTR